MSILMTEGISDNRLFSSFLELRLKEVNKTREIVIK